MVDIKGTVAVTTSSGPGVISLNLPSDIQAGEILYLHARGQDKEGSFPEGPPEGWTLVDASTIDSPLLAYKEADGSEGSTVDFDLGPNTRRRIMLVFRTDPHTREGFLRNETSGTSALFGTPQAQSGDLVLRLGSAQTDGNQEGILTAPAEVVAVEGTGGGGNNVAATISKEVITQDGEIASASLDSTESIFLEATVLVLRAETFEIAGTTPLQDGQPFTISGSGFSASGNTVTISPTNDITDVNAIVQTITTESETEIHVDSASVPESVFVFVFVEDSGGAATDGFEVQVAEPALRVDEIGGSRVLRDTDTDALIEQADLPIYVYRVTAPQEFIGEYLVDVVSGEVDDISAEPFNVTELDAAFHLVAKDGDRGGVFRASVVDTAGET